jgi:cytochrome c biogenesis protein CcdA
MHDMRDFTMGLLILAFLGGVLTIISPCILPVLPFVFSRADLPFRRSGLPLLVGMAVTFAGLAAVATVGGGWIVRANQYGRIAALLVLAILGVLLGVATGLLWAPCAGPILGLILTGAAVEGASSHSAFLLLAYAVGAATSLAVALLAGGRIFGLLKRSLGAEVWIRRVLGVAVLAGVAVVAFGTRR